MSSNSKHGFVRGLRNVYGHTRLECYSFVLGNYRIKERTSDRRSERMNMLIDAYQC